MDACSLSGSCAMDLAILREPDYMKALSVRRPFGGTTSWTMKPPPDLACRYTLLVECFRREASLCSGLSSALRLLLCCQKRTFRRCDRDRCCGAMLVPSKVVQLQGLWEVSPRGVLPSSETWRELWKFSSLCLREAFGISFACGRLRLREAEILWAIMS